MYQTVFAHRAGVLPTSYQSALSDDLIDIVNKMMDCEIEQFKVTIHVRREDTKGAEFMHECSVSVF